MSDEEVLQERITAYWNHKLNREFEKSYTYEDPFFRKNSSVTQYVNSFKKSQASWISVQTERIIIDKDSATADMKIKFKIAVSPSKTTEQEAVVKENWIKVDNVWYHVKK